MISYKMASKEQDCSFNQFSDIIVEGEEEVGDIYVVETTKRENTNREHNNACAEKECQPCNNHNNKVNHKLSAMDTKIVLNIGGKKYVTFQSTLLSIPRSRLGNLHRGDPTYDIHSGEYFFDRNPKLFPFILDCYRNQGELHFPHNFCGPVIKRELHYWKLPESKIAPCCWKSYKNYEEEEETLDLLDKTFNMQKTELFGEERSENPSYVRHGWQKWRRDILMFLEDPASSTYAKIWSYMFISLLLLSIGVTCADTHPLFRVKSHDQPPVSLANETNSKLIMYLTTHPHPVLQSVEYICTFIFATELTLKFIIWPKKKTFFMSFFNIIDMLSVIPMVINSYIVSFYPFFWAKRNIFIGYCVISLASVFRAIRVLKLVKHNKGLQIIYLAMRTSAQEIVLLLLLMFIGTLVFSTMIYFAEFEQENNFMNIPIGFWWSIITMTTVGYGDEHPTSTPGYLVGSLCAIAGMIATAMPIPMIANSFHLYYTYDRIRSKLELKRKEGEVFEIESYQCDFEANGLEVESNEKVISKARKKKRLKCRNM